MIQVFQFKDFNNFLLSDSEVKGVTYIESNEFINNFNLYLTSTLKEKKAFVFSKEPVTKINSGKLESEGFYIEDKSFYVGKRLHKQVFSLDLENKFQNFFTELK